MAVINKIKIDNTTYDVEDAILKDTVENLRMPYSNSASYDAGSVGAAIQSLDTGGDIATSAELLTALYS